MIMKGQQQLDMDKWIEKGDVLIEALPYIQRFNRKIIVVKYGGCSQFYHLICRRCWIYWYDTV